MTDDRSGSKSNALFGGPFGIALVVAVLAAIAAIPLLMKLAPSSDDSAASSESSITVATGQIGSGADSASATSIVSGDIRKGTLAIKEYSATEVGTGDLIGGRIMLVSASGPGVVMFDNGKSYTAGTVMPNGHVIDSIDSDRIVLEREKVVSVVRLQ